VGGSTGALALAARGKSIVELKTRDFRQIKERNRRNIGNILRMVISANPSRLSVPGNTRRISLNPYRLTSVPVAISSPKKCLVV